MRARGKRFINGFLIVLLLAGFAGACKKSSAPRSVAPGPALAMPEPAPPERKLPPLPTRALSPRLRAMRERAMETAAEKRGLVWLGEVGMTELSGWEYGARTKELADVIGTEDLTGLGRLGVAGGMLPEGTDLAALAVSFTALSAGATYSPLDKQVLLVSDDPKGGGFRNGALLAHEFVHALQDQHFDLMKILLARPFNFDRTEALFAVVEGDATAVERRVQQGDSWARKALEEIARAEDARFAPYRGGIGALFPPLLTETFIFRYRDGVRFVESVRRARPEGGLDELFRRPPQSSEQVLHPEKYFSGEAPRDVQLDVRAFEERGWRMTASTPLGEVGVRGLLMAGVAVGEARRAAAGWGGDRAFVFEREGKPALFVWKTVWDKPSDAREFFRAYGALKGGARQDGPAAAWPEGALQTRVVIEGDAVTVLRGAASDLDEALGLS